MFISPLKKKKKGKFIKPKSTGFNLIFLKFHIPYPGPSRVLQKANSLM